MYIVRIASCPEAIRYERKAVAEPAYMSLSEAYHYPVNWLQPNVIISSAMLGCQDYPLEFSQIMPVACLIVRSTQSKC
jgi:hypothetical protein